MKKIITLSTLALLALAPNHTTFAGKGDTALTKEQLQTQIDAFVNLFPKKMQKRIWSNINLRKPCLNLDHDSFEIKSLPESFWDKLKPIGHLFKYVSIENFDLGPNVDVGIFPNVNILSLSECNIASLTNFEQLSHLTGLNLGGNPLKAVPQGLNQLPLRMLSFSECSLTDVPVDLLPSSLKILILAGNNAQSLDLRPLKNLEFLMLGEGETKPLLNENVTVHFFDSSFSKIPEEFFDAVDDFVNLFDEDQRESIAYDLKNNSSLELSDIDVLPQDFFEKLKPFAHFIDEIHFESVSLGKTFDIGMFSNLTELSLINCGLQNITGFEKLKKPIDCDLSDNPLEKVSEGLQYAALTRLVLRNCRLISLPDFLFADKNAFLSYIDLRLNELPIDDRFKKLKMLFNLHVSENFTENARQVLPDVFVNEGEGEDESSEEESSEEDNGDYEQSDNEGT